MESFSLQPEGKSEHPSQLEQYPGVCLQIAERANDIILPMAIGTIPDPESQEVVGDKPEVTITLRRFHLYAILMPLVFVLGFGLGYLVWGRVPSASPAVAEVAPTPAQPAAAQDQTAVTEETQQVVRYDIPVDDDPVLGPEDAPITIIEFTDYECPYCRKWHAEVFPKLVEAYPDQVRLVYRDFPLTSIHVNAQPAAEAANCANEQGAFWDYTEKLFKMEQGLSAQAYSEYASQLDLDAQAFKDCLESGRYKEEIQSDFDFAANLGVRSTPTFFINGIAIVGAQPFEVFQQVIEKELAGEIP
jgi:protein-disulfide isomerase